MGGIVVLQELQRLLLSRHVHIGWCTLCGLVARGILDTVCHLVVARKHVADVCLGVFLLAAQIARAGHALSISVVNYDIHYFRRTLHRDVISLGVSPHWILPSHGKTTADGVNLQVILNHIDKRAAWLHIDDGGTRLATPFVDC